MMRAKMKVIKVDANEYNETISMTAVCKAEGYPEDGSDENNTFAKFTPSADLTMQIANPDLLGKLKPGQELYLDFSPAE
ncbi:hypothetical protein [Geopsychrobacter electrodiphilus]|uniref:hypothetical protein n=1 Tax=Geopsychrobacter electrodiphilus TaxID=225196 RepID=UPI0003736511|nr:hypothetical protein [Geopsychrobacter electrodiphilus]